MSDRTFLNWPFFAPHHAQLAHELDSWCTAELGSSHRCLPQAARSDAQLDAETRKLVADLGAAGWLRYCVIAPHGGAATQLEVRSLCLCRETLARHLGLADFAFAMQGLGTGPISLFGSEAQRARFLPAVARGDCIAAFAISEQHAGSDVANLRTRATKDGDTFVVRGTKTWISNAGIADHYIVFARVGDGPGTNNLAAFIVEAGTPGLYVSERIETLAPHPLGSLVLDDCRIPSANLIEGIGAGFRIAMATLDVFRSTVGAAALGMARRALDETLSRVTRREVAGRPLADCQLTQAKLADMATRIDVAALLVYRAAWTKDQLGQRISREAAMAKLAATEAAQQVIDDAVQLFGAQGVVRGSAPEQLYREIRALRIYEGTSEIQRLIIARQLLSGTAARTSTS
ncbi:MAG: acyl-CoA dehydrogenase family protein [Nannocystaceae bacterium]